MIQYIEKYRSQIAIFILGLIILALLLTCQNGCNKGKLVTDNTQQYKAETIDNDIIQISSANHNALLIKYDSLLKVKQKYIKGKERVRDSLIYVSDTICHHPLIAMYTECLKTDSVNNSIISNLQLQGHNDTIAINSLTDKVNIKQERINKDSLQIIQINKDSKRKGFKRFIQGGVIGVGIGMIGTLLIIK